MLYASTTLASASLVTAFFSKIVIPCHRNMFRCFNTIEITMIIMYGVIWLHVIIASQVMVLKSVQGA